MEAKLREPAIKTAFISQIFTATLLPCSARFGDVLTHFFGVFSKVRESPEKAPL